jgi:hypothetical protein
MITTKLMGGLGNQMFQYAFAKSLSLKYDTPFQIDLSFLNGSQTGCTKRKYDLDLFNLKVNVYSGKSSNILINEPHFHYSPHLIKSVGDRIKADKNVELLFEGYWQTPLYFNEFESEIRNSLSFKEGLDTNFNFANSCSLHVRRGDYVDKSHFHPLLEISYYKKAIDIINPTGQIYVFSDDLNWCKENLNFREFTFIEGKSNHEDFKLMSACSNNIIANSSFSWWAAYLNKNKNKKVVAPIRWFTQDHINTSDLIPDDWLRI